MKRYRVVYSKRGFPLVAWYDSKTDARNMAARLRQAGYSVDVWEYAESGAHKIAF